MVLLRSALASWSITFAIVTVFLLISVEVEADDIGDCILSVVTVEVDVLAVKSDGICSESSCSGLGEGEVEEGIEVRMGDGV